jgi:SH3 domain protein
VLPAIKQELANCQSQSSHQIATIREITTEKEKTLAGLESRNQELEETLNETQKTLSKLQGERDENSSRVQREWFVTGAAVLGVGIIAGLLFASMSRRKQPGNW